MIAATYTDQKGFAVGNIAAPVLGGDIEAVLSIRAASICGTDLKIVRHGHRKLKRGQRIVLGHELVGEIIEMTSVVEEFGFSIGDRVGIAPNIGCGLCHACQSGRPNYCARYEAFGITFDGSHSELLGVPAKYFQMGNVQRLPDDVSDSDASLLEPLSCVVNGTKVVRIEVGDQVVIYGPGTMGLLFVQLARLSGASNVIVVGRNQARLAKAVELGADAVINNTVTPASERILDLTGGSGADVAVIACASPEPQLEATGILAPFGRLCLFGSLPKGAGQPAFDTNSVHYKNLVVSGTTGGSVNDYRTAVRLVAARRLNLQPIIGAEYPFSELEEAYESALSRESPGKVVVTRNRSV